jgi:Hemopexin
MANERMINSVSVGVVYVDSPGAFAISNAEKTHILAEIQDGLDTLATNEPRSNVSWTYSTLSVTLPSFTPWEGANWPGLTEPFYRWMDAALWSETNQKIYFFRGSEYIRIDPANGWRADPGYPKPVAGNWPGFPANFATSVDTALWSDTNKKIYFFKGSEYIRVDPNNSWNVDPGYPKPIAGNWPGFPANFATGVDASLWSYKNTRIYFFKGNEYIRVDPNNSWNVDAGYPKPITGNWPGFPTDFAEGVDAALWAVPNQKIYFFKRNRFYNQYIRVDANNGWNVDPGYPKPVGLGWEAEDKWRDPALVQLGFPTGGDGITQLTQFFQSGVAAQFGYIAFFTKMPTAWFAYEGGLRVVMRQVSGAFTSWTSIDSVFGHETGHVFGAPDEYAASDCTCTSVHGKFFRAVNGNCDNCATNPVICLMKGNNLTNLCEWTPAHIGWEAFLDNVDDGLHAVTNNKLYMFDGKYYVRYSPGFALDPDYPKPIAGNWPGFPANFASGIDACLWAEKNTKIYFFKGSEYIRVDPNNSWNVDPGYPKPIAGNWPGFPADFATGLDAALDSKPNQKLYFFKGSEYIRVDPNNSWNVDPGYPKPIAGNWPGFPADFATGVDAAEWAEFNQRIYFFKGTRYLRVDPAANWNVEGGYPRFININWRMAFPTA